MKIKIIAVLLTVLVLAAGCTRSEGGSQARSAQPYTIEIGGSTSVTPLMELFKEEYERLNPHIKININGTGSGDGIRNAGVMYQIGMSSRELTPAEQGQGLNAVTVAIDGIAVIMNKNSPVSNLSMDQIRGIYTGEITNWSQVSGGAKSGRIAVISREEGSGTRGAFEELVGFQGKLVAGANESTSTGAIKAGIVQNTEAIGYISLGSVDDTIQAISVGGIAPANDNVKNGSYRIARPFIVLTGSNVHPESTAFVDWMLSPEGQQIVSRSWITVR
ncbi:MAG: phosphate ABC transporter substrate-binding protein [Treponema sp.]|nr:phosphate ABC transporter substrate-binding protein [Treponema sp.]MCL2238145.1 phosphate ABC transporter substrate-binding protein [Treponema sp.]